MDREYVMRQLPLVLLPVLLTQQVIILLLVGQRAWWWWYLAWLQPVGWVWMAWAWVVFCRRLRNQAGRVEIDCETAGTKKPARGGLRTHIY